MRQTIIFTTKVLLNQLQDFKSKKYNYGNVT